MVVEDEPRVRAVSVEALKELRQGVEGSLTAKDAEIHALRSRLEALERRRPSGRPGNSNDDRP